MKRRLWKTFYITSGQTLNDLDSLWQDMRRGSRHTMKIDHAMGVVETNLPISEVRAMFRMFDKRMPSDYTTDVAPTS